MNPAEIETALRTAFIQCEQAYSPLSDRQKEILLKVVIEQLIEPQDGDDNPLDDLTSQQRQLLLQFIKEQERLDSDWKIALLNDWLNNRNSGSVQFIRKEYGFIWLSRIQPIHIEAYQQQGDRELNLGLRIEVCNALWEWVQKEDPTSYEWFPCTVINILEVVGGELPYTSCIVRFENGLELEIQGIYEWNRQYWRFPKN
jgi:hypothetical protein